MSDEQLKLTIPVAWRVYTDAKADIAEWEPRPAPPEHFIDDYANPSAPYLDEVEREELGWLR